MERPSHITLTPSHRYRLPLLALAATLQVGVLWLFTHGLMTGIIHIPPDLHFTPTPEAATPRHDAPPLPPPSQKAQIPTTIMPVFDTERPAGERGITVQTGTGSGGTAVVVPVVPDRPAVSIASTHTVPPYPVVARRMGAEGKVTLQLTVAPTGRVSAAQVVTSSGSDDLDQAARQWILAHWAYRPALNQGQPVAGQATATVAFNLKDAR